jgi:tripartite-type tricarboxylate transporter receptor subunit TctC
LRGAAVLSGLSLLPRRARAAEWPTRPVKLLVPFAAGGTTDILARIVAAKVSEEFGQQFIVENKTGAGGNIAADTIAKADPDGYTFLVGTPGTHAINPFVFKNMPFDPIKDIAPVIIIARVPNLCSVTTSLPVKSVPELIAYAKSKPGELFYGTPGLGSTAHVSTELFKSMTGVEMTHVPYKGSAPALTDLIAGRVQLMIDNLPAAAPFAQAGQIRPLAVSTATRWPLLPDLPTIAEAGVPGYEAPPGVHPRRAFEDAEEIIGRAGRQRAMSLRPRTARAAAQDRRRTRGRVARGHAGLRGGRNREMGQVAKFAGIKPE